MRPGRLNRATRRGWRGIVTADRRRAVIVSASLAAILTLGFFTAGGAHFFSAVRPASSRTAAVIQKGSNEGTYRVGSILLIPASGDMCERRRFDNFSGRLLSMDLIKCEEALAQSKTNLPDSARDNTARMRAILSAFKK